MEKGIFWTEKVVPHSPLPYHTADGMAVSAVKVILRYDVRRVRIQVVPVRNRPARQGPPVATCDTFADVAVRTNVVARPEKVEEIAKVMASVSWRKILPSVSLEKVKRTRYLETSFTAFTQWRGVGSKIRNKFRIFSRSYRLRPIRIRPP